MPFLLRLTRFFVILKNRDLILGHLLLLISTLLRSLSIRIHTTTDILLVPTHVAVWTTLKILLLALIQDTMVSVSMNLFKLHRDWMDHPLRSIRIS